MPHNDFTFFTNEPDRDLYTRFNNILKNNTQFFDILVGYFRTSGFFKLYGAMEGVEKIRVLVGLNVDRKTADIINISHKKAKENFAVDIENEFAESDDAPGIEQGVYVFIDWLRREKMEMRMYTEAQIHAKVYIMRKDLSKNAEHYGSVITGSSNFSLAGLVNNLEFDVELKDSRDVGFALGKFEELWAKSVDIAEVYVDTATNKTWLKNDITPYELYLKTIHEYFEEEINSDSEPLPDDHPPEGFMRLEYQKHAVVDAQKKLESYGGVFISDVVGLGKTYICAMLAKRLNHGKKLVICPPVLVDYWRKVLFDFDVVAEVESLGKLDGIIERIEQNEVSFEYIFIDEAHRFRNSETENFKMLHQICYGKKVILISATPMNNYASDIENQLYLFQDRHNSNIMKNKKDLENYFRGLRAKLKKFPKGTGEYKKQQRSNSEDIRNTLLRNVMLRRTRRDITEFYGADLKKQGLFFPKLETPEKIVYTFDKLTDEVFTYTMRVIKTLKYARYTPLLYLKDQSQVKSMLTAQTNMGGFMKSILVKRLESSFHAFKNTLSRFIASYEKFIGMLCTGHVFISKKVNVYDLFDNGDNEKLMQLIEEEKVQYYKSEEFKDEYMEFLEKDFDVLKNLQMAWDEIKTDPKLDEFKRELTTNKNLIGQKIIIFTESKETANYLGSNLKIIYGERAVAFSGESSNILKKSIEDSFNPKNVHKDNDKYDILITTDILAEGINLHRSGVVINYDLPWNPTRMMQRVGRINRVGTEHLRIFVYNFFPTSQTEQAISLKDKIMDKLQAFHDTLGEDIKYLTEDEEIDSHRIYDDLNKDFEAEEEINQELAYLALIRKVRDEQTDLFAKIKSLPKKAKAGKHSELIPDFATVTFLRKGYFKMFFYSDGDKTEGMTFLEAIDLIKCEPDEKAISVRERYFNQLDKNKKAFDHKLSEEEEVSFENAKTFGNDAKMVNKIKDIMKCPKFTAEQDNNLKNMLELWKNGAIPEILTKEILRDTKNTKDHVQAYFEIFNRIPKHYFYGRGEQKNMLEGNKEIILSSYLENMGGHK